VTERSMPNHSSLSLVIDSNIWIYLYHCGLVDAAFCLGSLHAPDLMRMAEPLTEITWDDLKNQGAILDELAPNDVRALLAILASYRGLSYGDAACLVLAEKYGIPLVSHDNKLLNVARKRNVPAYNYDALLDLMVTEGIIKSEAPQAAIETLVRIGERPR
jgi:hypothetical protein